MRYALLLSATALLAAPSFGQSDAELLKTFELNPDFTLELVAREPLVLDPVDLEFDEMGRAFVLEMPGYPLRDEPGRVVILTDDNQDGRFDKRVVYAEGFAVACSILPYRGGLLIASPPDVLYLEDRDGDNVAEVQTTVLSGFPDGNTQHNFNGLTHGLDNWIYAANGGNSGSPYWPDAPDEKMSIRWVDFRFDLGKRSFEAIGRSSGGFGLTLNSVGQIFETHNLAHVQHLVFPGRYTDGIANASTLAEIASYTENGLARIYPIGEQVERPNHPEQAGYFSAACGITCYTGGAFAPDYNENVFVGDAVLNLVHRMTIHPDGTGLEARRGEDRKEFLASADRWFRPVNMAVGPDGALYVLDMHRENIEHPEWIPDEMEAHMDLKAGSREGRIFRIAPKGGLPAVVPSFPRDDLPKVVAYLAHPNKWWRDTAQRLLVDWHDSAAVEPLEAMATDTTLPAVARIHALWTLEGLDALSEKTLATIVVESAAEVREQALIVLEKKLEANPALVSLAIGRCSDDDARVRRQALLCLSTQGGLPFSVLEGAAARTLSENLDDVWMRLALLATLKQHALDAVDLLLKHANNTPDEGARIFLGQLCTLASHDGFDRAAENVLPLLANGKLSDEAIAAALMGLASGPGNPTSSLTQQATTALDQLMARSTPDVAGPAWEIADKLGHQRPDLIAPMLAASRDTVENTKAPVEDRLDHLALVSHAPFSDRFALLQDIVLSPAPRELQEAAMAQLSSEGSEAVASWLIENWTKLGPALVGPATDILLYRRPNQPLMLSALEDGRLAIGQFNLDLERRRRLLFSKDDAIRQRAEKLFSDAGVVTRRDAITAMEPALSLTGDPAPGKLAYVELCSKCHRVEDDGHEVGPNLTEIFRKDKRTLLQDILDPNAAVDPHYINYTVTLKNTDPDAFADAAPVGGIVVAETDATITIRAAGGIEKTYARYEIESLTSSGLSTMPEGLELGMQPQQMADLLAFLQTPR